VRGIVVRSPNIAQGSACGLKQLIGGNIGAYAQVCEQARCLRPDGGARPPNGRGRRHRLSRQAFKCYPS
jgi:hypothetical protein